MPSLKFTFSPAPFKTPELEELRSTFDRLRHTLINTALTHWDRTLREWFELHEGGMPSNEELAQHGLWLDPAFSSIDCARIFERTFKWRGKPIFTGWIDLASGTHQIHPVA